MKRLLLGKSFPNVRLLANDHFGHAPPENCESMKLQIDSVASLVFWTFLHLAVSL